MSCVQQKLVSDGGMRPAGEPEYIAEDFIVRGQALLYDHESAVSEFMASAFNDATIDCNNVSISKSGKFRFDHVAPTSLSRPFDDLTTARSHM